MSLSAIQDNLVKTTLVQHTQTKVDDVNRSHENAVLAKQHEMNRQEDQVVIQSRQSDEEKGLKPDDEKERRRRRGEEREAEDREKADEDEEEEGPGGPRAKMRRINIVI